MKKNFFKAVSLILFAVVLVSAALAGCENKKPPQDTTAPVTDNTDATSGQTLPGDTTAPDENGTTAPEGGDIKAPDYINPLTGLESKTDVSKKRPASIVINNVKPTLPQIGISKADALVELLYEGGETRLMMVVMDYENLSVVGPVRSARDYAVRFSQDFGSVFVHAGADTNSEMQLAMNAIRYGFMASYLIKTGAAKVALDVKDLWTDGVNNIDGVNAYYPMAVFYRDQERKLSMGLEHSLMTTGDGLVSGISYMGYKTSFAEPFDYPYSFVEYGAEKLPGKGEALHILIPYSTVQIPQLIYNKNTGKYDRYQLSGEEHIDGATGEQLAFDNVILIFLKTSLIPGDSALRLNIDYTGSGSGYYACGGRYEEIKWSRQDANAALVLTDSSGNPLLINPGNVYFGVCSSSMYSGVQLNYYN